MAYDAIVLGGGAAGLFAAAVAGKRGKRVLVIERNHEVGRKIAISGGGRCNFTNLNVTPENFLSKNPHFCKSALARFDQHDFISLVKKHRIEFYEKKAGQLFCKGSSRQVIDLLLAECREARVRIESGVSVDTIEKPDQFVVRSGESEYRANCIVVATGGLSFPKIGATELGYRIARQFGHSVTELRPSLVSLVSKEIGSAKLAGVSVEGIASVGKASFRDQILFTHNGLSGPAILQVSNYWEKRQPVFIDLLPDLNLDAFVEMLRTSGKNVENVVTGILPTKLAVIATGNLGGIRSSELSKDNAEKLFKALKNREIRFTGTGGYDRAEVTLGGVVTDEISSRTMESKLCPGIFFIGEVLDVTGWLGGYNFQWAWSSGAAAGNAI